MNYFFTLCFIFWSLYANACPNCAGVDSAGKDTQTAYILITFILLAYIPFYIIFRVVKKYSNINNSKKNYAKGK